MKIRPRRKAVLLGIALAVAIAALIWALTNGQWGAGSGEQGEKALGGAHAGVSVRDGTIILDKAAQERGGIAAAALKPVSHQKEVQAYGAVLELQGLVNQRKALIDMNQQLVNLQNGYAAAKAEVDKGKAALDASSKQYQRMKTLYKEDQNTSAKAYQAAEATWRSDQAGLQAAQVAVSASQKSIEAAQEILQAALEGLRQEWGPVLTDWLSQGASSFQQLIRQQKVLIQITLPAGVQIPSGSESVQIQSTSGASAAAYLVSPSPRTDRRFQGMSFFYTATAQPGLLPGMNVAARVPSGPPREGFVIPDSAVVRWQGKPWVYVQKGSDRFVRREIAGQRAAEGGLFVREGFSAEDRVVVKGAQLLLSEETSVRKGGGKGGEAEE